METSNLRLEIARVFFEVNKSLKHGMRNYFENLGITVPQGMVIGVLMKSGEIKISELSKKVNLTNSTVSGIVDRLEIQGLVERSRSETDRRIVYVKTTPKVKEIFKELYKKSEELFEELLSNGTHQEFEKILEGLVTLNRILKDRENGPAK